MYHILGLLMKNKLYVFVVCVCARVQLILHFKEICQKLSYLICEMYNELIELNKLKNFCFLLK